MNYAKLTKADLIKVIAAQETQILDLGRQLEVARMKRAAAAPAAPSYAAHPAATHRAYYDYVAYARQLAKERGDKVVRYLAFAQWAAMVQAGGYRPDQAAAQ